MSPLVYWDISPSEVGMYIEAKRDKTIGGMHEDDYYELEERREKLIAEGVNVL